MTTCPTCNIAVLAGQDIEIYPHAIDPDGDQLQYSYFEWKGLLWEESPLYQTSKKDARLITASPIDVGTHKVLVIATDNQGLYDYQNLTVLVQAP